MATAPLPTPEAIKDAPNIIKIPNTLIGETFGSLWKLSESRVLDNGVVCSTYLFGGNI